MPFMSSYTVAYVSPYRESGLFGIEGALDAINIRSRLIAEGRWEELSRSERDYVSVIQSGLDEVARIRERTAASLRTRVIELSKESRVADEGITELHDHAQGVDATRLVESSIASSGTSKPETTTGTIDLSAAFAALTPRKEIVTPTLAERGNALLERLTKLIPLGQHEDEERSGMIEDVQAALESKDENAFTVIESRARALCLRMEDGGRKRLEDYARYLALCEIREEMPQELSYGAMLSAIERLQADLVRSRVEEKVAHDVEEAMAEVGLTSMGSFTLDESEGLIATDKQAPGVGLFVHRSTDGALMFTTLSATDPETLGNEGRARVREGVRQLCQDKERLLREALAKRGLVIESCYNSPVDLKRVRYAPTAARYISRQETSSSEEQKRITTQQRAGD